MTSNSTQAATNNPALMNEILDLIFSAVNLKQVSRESISPATPLMTDGLGLDSVDILEVVIALERQYNVQIANDGSAKEIFANIGSLVKFIENHQAARS